MSKNKRFFPQIALVTGANRGIGLEVCRQLAQQGIEVILTSRTVQGKKAAAQLQKDGLHVRYHRLDVTTEKSRKQMYEWVVQKYGRLDILVNNAGIFLDNKDSEIFGTSAFQSSLNILRRTLETNVYGPFRLCQLFIPQMRKNAFGRVVNVSSRMGQLSTMEKGDAAYRISKTALNAVTRIFAEETVGDNILVNSVHPGWVRTKMGGLSAPLTVEQGARGIVWAALLPNGGPTGKFFQDGKEMEW